MELIPKHLVVIVGPTAVGKTALSIQLAEYLQCEILSADSRQFYYDMAIGTAQPTKEEMRGIPHHFLSFLPVQELYTAGKFAKEARQKLTSLFIDHDIAILIGGSGLYIKALCEGLADFPPVAPNLRAMLNLNFKERGLHYLTEMLAQKDPDYYHIVDLKNPKRIIRALEICLSTGVPYSTLRKQLPSVIKTFNVIPIGITQEKHLLYERIELRVDIMMQQGLLQEVEKLHPYKELNALQTLGYKELFDYIDGVSRLDESINQIKINTKKYAKKQITWFQKDKSIAWFAPDDITKIYAYIQSIVEL
ncbi:tRNA (adenosine(37)-N6)-dimethylallyltransferase MiaA [Cardinium endosymbiont of Culicoides punctatus]|uniref:tRNA (adenosine(37)-N6)-dimethylallyltransferase MiaA n=1 Tax=Cardinium endosymbiont of Culicoides punctatus TaxID=2304601 RepID=UPI00105861C2|nr:tRNA (adenosine(37)-N6)-dimethylallyltransferase MiaA [Cardinium endosymbiont of Culicoides punctatus]TDG95739.1 tRNA dimethylallyltransferase [Cardinium endosymbiont of Culicoides punctatus]